MKVERIVIPSLYQRSKTDRVSHHETEVLEADAVVQEKDDKNEKDAEHPGHNAKHEKSDNAENAKAETVAGLNIVV